MLQGRIFGQRSFVQSANRKFPRRGTRNFEPVCSAYLDANTRFQELPPAPLESLYGIYVETRIRYAPNLPSLMSFYLNLNINPVGSFTLLILSSTSVFHWFPRKPYILFPCPNPSSRVRCSFGKYRAVLYASLLVLHSQLCMCPQNTSYMLITRNYICSNLLLFKASFVLGCHELLSNIAAFIVCAIRDLQGAFRLIATRL